jgi:hypothetical protein
LGELECPNPVKTSNTVAVAKSDAAHPFQLVAHAPQPTK